MSEDAVAPVIAAMLVLAVLATFFAAWNSYYIPSMKAQAETGHLGSVETAILKFSSDIDAAASLEKPMKLSEPVPLGGGETLFDPVKSGGYLEIRNGSPKNFLRVNWTSDLPGPNPDEYSGLVDISYEPVGNFWQDQGYLWANGTVYVRNGERNLSTPLLFTREQNIPYNITESLAGVGYSPDPFSSGNCSSLTLRTVTFQPDPEYSRVSGNGNAMLELVSTVPPPRSIVNATSLNISASARFPEKFRSGLWSSLNTDINRTLAGCSGNIHRTVLTDNEVQITFDTYPLHNTTLVLERTEIRVRAY